MSTGLIHSKAHADTEELIEIESGAIWRIIQFSISEEGNSHYVIEAITGAKLAKPQLSHHSRAKANWGKVKHSVLIDQPERLASRDGKIRHPQHCLKMASQPPCRPGMRAAKMNSLQYRSAGPVCGSSKACARRVRWEDNRTLTVRHHPEYEGFSRCHRLSLRQTQIPHENTFDPLHEENAAIRCLLQHVGRGCPHGHAANPMVMGWPRCLQARPRIVSGETASAVCARFRACR